MHHNELILAPDIRSQDTAAPRGHQSRTRSCLGSWVRNHLDSSIGRGHQPHYLEQRGVTILLIGTGSSDRVLTGLKPCGGPRAGEASPDFLKPRELEDGYINPSVTHFSRNSFFSLFEQSVALRQFASFSCSHFNSSKVRRLPRTSSYLVVRATNDTNFGTSL